MRFSSVLVALGLVSCVLSAQWVVIVAGSNGYSNYRHQADSCHAYQIAKKHGVPDENIIHFAYNDIAHNIQNPFPGKVYNKPNGDDVYAGCKIDYEKQHVTPDNYLKVLKGQKTASTPKVLESTSEDTVFLNFADHGAPGLIAFPSQYLYATDLLAALKAMNDKKMYKKLIYYLEACESGSMFTSLPTNLSIYATTAANATESSWGTYCPPQDNIGSKHVGSCLGDLYSVNWMEDVDKNIAGETLDDQFKTILKLTTKSHPMQFGDLSFTSDKVADWLSPAKTKTQDYCDLHGPQRNSIDSRDIKLHYLINRHAQNLSEETMNELNVEIVSRKNFDDIFAGVRKIHDHLPVAPDTDFDCYKAIIDLFEQQCGRFSDYGMKYMRSFYDVCYHKAKGNLNEQDYNNVVAEFTQICSEGPVF